MTNAKVEILAQLYLQSKPAEISDTTIAQLCDWLMEEFHNLPLNLEFSNYPHYENAIEMFADIEQDHLWVSADSYDAVIYPNPIYGFILQAVHDSCYDKFAIMKSNGFVHTVGQPCPAMEQE
jgi:hypothetical protein